MSGANNVILQKGIRLIGRLFQRYRKEFLQEILSDNIYKLSRIALIFIFFEIIFSITVYYNGLSPVPNLSFVIFSLIIVPMLLAESKKKKHNVFSVILIYVYLFAVLLLGMSLTFRNRGISDSSYIYIMMVFGITSTVTCTPLNNLLLLSTSYGIFLFWCGRVISDPKAAFLLVGNTLTMNIIAWILGNYIFKLRYKNFLKNQVLMKRNRTLELLSKSDGLTGLFNHKFTYMQLYNTIKSFNEDDNPLSIAMLDIDNFKTINDAYGHIVGDKIIHQFAGLIRSHIRAYDIAGRYGGDEFLIILKNADQNETLKIIRRLKETAENHRWPEELKIRFSCGISEYYSGTAEDLVRMTDKKLYYVKRNGKNNYLADLPEEADKEFLPSIDF